MRARLPLILSVLALVLAALSGLVALSERARADRIEECIPELAGFFNSGKVDRWGDITYTNEVSQRCFRTVYGDAVVADA